MTPFLVQVRIPDLTPPDVGAMTIYVAMVETEERAIEAVRGAVPVGWAVEGVIGRATAGIVEHYGLERGMVQQLG